MYVKFIDNSGLTDPPTGRLRRHLLGVSTQQGWNVVTTIGSLAGDNAVVRFSSLILPGPLRSAHKSDAQNADYHRQRIAPYPLSSGKTCCPPKLEAFR